MLLDFNEIIRIATGYSVARRTDESISFYRMTESQKRCFSSADNSAEYEFAKKCDATAGIALDFYTDSLFFKFTYDNAVKASSRDWYYFDLLVNGRLVDTTGEENAIIRSGEIYRKLDGKLNRITLYFPNLYRAEVTGVELSDGAKSEPAKKKGRIVVYGDSITQGYDSRNPSLSYINILGRLLNYEIINLGVGSAFFDDKYIDENADYNETAIMIALGINDYVHHGQERIAGDCRKFLEKIGKIHKGKPVHLILPIDYYETEETPSSAKLPELRKRLIKVAEDFGNVTVIDTTGFVFPKKENFSPDGVHPVETGAIEYATELKNRFNKIIKY